MCTKTSSRYLNLRLSVGATDGALLIRSYSVGNTTADVYPGDGRTRADRRSCVRDLSRGTQ